MTPSDAATHLPRAVQRQLSSTTDWLSGWWPAAVCALVLVVLVAAAVVLRRRARALRLAAGRPRRWPWLAATAACVVALVAGCALAANTISGYVPSVRALATQVTSFTGGAAAGTTTATRSATSTVTITAPPRDRITATQAWVYTPPGYDQDPAQRYPVVYLLHGSPGRAVDWFAAGDVAHQMDVLIAAHLVRPMIVVAPDVNGSGIRDSECLNTADAARSTQGPQVETYLDDVVVPFVDHRYRTRADWQHRVIGGMSSGGYCALDQGLRHPDLYGSIIALEPYGNPGAGGRAALGRADRAGYAAHSPSAYIPTMTFAHPVHVLLDEGSRAPAVSRGHVAALAAALRARGQPVTARLEEGYHHSWSEARRGAPYGLVMASAAMPT